MKHFTSRSPEMEKKWLDSNTKAAKDMRIYAAHRAIVSAVAIVKSIFSTLP